MVYMNHDLRCPKCNRSGKVIFEPSLIDVKHVACEFCRHKLPLYEGIPDFAEDIPFDDPKSSPFQKLNNSSLFASLYETPFWRPLLTRIGSGISMEDEVQEVFAMAGKRSAYTVVDLACGTGHYARAFARELPKAFVYGLDISLNMLKQARKIAQRQGLATIIFLRADVHRLPFDNESVDRINCGGALHLLPDLSAVLTEVSRVVKPGGVLTAMTLTFAPGILHHLMRQWLVKRGRVKFFRPDQLAADCRSVGFSEFEYRQHRTSLIFSAVKHPVRSEPRGA